MCFVPSRLAPETSSNELAGPIDFLLRVSGLRTLVCPTPGARLRNLIISCRLRGHPASSPTLFEEFRSSLIGFNCCYRVRRPACGRIPRLFASILHDVAWRASLRAVVVSIFLPSGSVSAYLIFLSATLAGTLALTRKKFSQAGPTRNFARKQKPPQTSDF